jgi:hypothetical protein
VKKGSYISFYILSIYGYNNIDNNKEEIQNIIKFLAVLLPSITSIISLILMIYFPIDKNIHEKILNSLKEKKNGKHKILDPISNKIINFENNEINEKKIDVFYHFNLNEIKYLIIDFKKNENLKREFCYCLFFFLISIYLLISFVLNLFNNREDLLTFIYLWISSLTFSTFFYFYERVKAWNLMKNIKKEELIMHYEKRKKLE